MKALGIFGLAIPEPYGDAPVSTPCYAEVTAELARGWMSLAGAMGGHTVVAKLLLQFGTEEQKQRYLPRMATGEMRATMALTEPGGGSDLQAMTTIARPDGDGYLVNGAKTWITNARRSQLIALLCKTDPAATPRHRGISILLVEHGAGLVVSRDLPKLGYKGVESCELSFADYRAPADALLGGEPGRGFAQMMKGLEIGRIQVASRAVGVAQAAFDDALRYAQERESFGEPIWKHQADRRPTWPTWPPSSPRPGSWCGTPPSGTTPASDATWRPAWPSCSPRRPRWRSRSNAVRIHGGYGYSTEYDVERYFRDAPLMIVGEGTNEIQRNVIAAQLISRGGLGQLTGRRPAGPRATAEPIIDSCLEKGAAAAEETGSKSARTRERILDAAAHVLSRKGYAGTRLSDVADQAEIQAPAIYYYFPSRDDLIEEVMWSGIAHMREHWPGCWPRCRLMPVRSTASTPRSRRTCGTPWRSPTTPPRRSGTRGRSRKASRSGTRPRHLSTATCGASCCRTRTTPGCCGPIWIRWPPGCWCWARSTGRPSGGIRAEARSTSWCGPRNRWSGTGWGPSPPRAATTWRGLPGLPHGGRGPGGPGSADVSSARKSF